jgi:phosphoribosylanthranilate isomerase
MMRVKICGITRLDDAVAAAEAGADFIGLNFYRKSPRFLEVGAARDLVRALREQLGAACPLFVGVFVNAATYEISTTATTVELDAIQLSGDESLEVMKELRLPTFKAIQPPNGAMARDDAAYFSQHPTPDERFPSLLLDAYHPTLRGGTGEGASAEVIVAVSALTPRLMLAGGLTPDNVAERVAQFRPWAVDVASGVESGAAGVKDHDKMRQFIVRAKAGV